MLGMVVGTGWVEEMEDVGSKLLTAAPVSESLSGSFDDRRAVKK